MDGFWFADEAIQAPSVTNRFFTSWHWLWAFSTDVFGSRPIRAVPISWIVRPGGLSSTNDVTSLAPAASSMSAAPLEAVASQELRMRRLHIAEPGDVNPVGAIPVGRAVFHAGDHAPRAAAHGVVHQVLAQLAARVSEPGREAGGLRVQEDARGFEGRRTQEDDARAELERLLSLPVDDAHSRGAAALLVVDQTVHDAVRPQREAPRGAGRR